MDEPAYFPDSLTAEQRQELAAAIEWLKTKWGEGRPCPYCGANAWGVGEPVWVVINFAGREPTLQRMSPAFTVMCRNCGHTTFVNSIVAGITPHEGTSLSAPEQEVESNTKQDS